MSVKYPVAEKFMAPQGEGLYSGTQMSFVRLVGCSVGQNVCTACDTSFDRSYPELGGGTYTPLALVEWAGACRHICLTGGEPLDRDLRPLVSAALEAGKLCHVETSGTRHPDWLDAHEQPRQPGQHAVGYDRGDGMLAWKWQALWVTVSPKPGFLPEMVGRVADEIKLILGGLGDGPGWPTVEDALRWSAAGKTVYVQPRNERLAVDRRALDEALEVVAAHPQLRLSVQLHKFVRTR